MIQTFLFDMGNVLVRFSHERMCAQIGGLCGKTSAEIRELLFESGLQWDFERGVLSEAEFHRRFEQLVDQDLDIDQLVYAGSNIFDLNDDLVPVIDSLRSQGYRLVLLSNTSISHFEFVARHYSVLDRFDDFVLSYQVGALKPHAAIFDAALKAIRCEPERCFYTDDIADYVAAGRKRGLQAEVFTTTSALIEQLAARGIELSQTVAVGNPVRQCLESRI